MIKRFTVLGMIVLMMLVVSAVIAGQAGNSNTFQLPIYDIASGDVIGKAHVTMPPPGIPVVKIVVNLKGLDREDDDGLIEYTIKSQGQIVGIGNANKGGNLTVVGVIDDKPNNNDDKVNVLANGAKIGESDLYNYNPVD